MHHLPNIAVDLLFMKVGSHLPEELSDMTLYEPSEHGYEGRVAADLAQRRRREERSEASE